VDAFNATAAGSRAYSQGTGVTWRIEVTAVGFGAAASRSNNAQVYIPNPPPPRNIAAYKGAQKFIGTCSDSSCSFVGVEVWNYSPNTTYTVSVNSSAGYLGTDTITTDGAGHARRDTKWVFGYPTGWVSVTVDGLTGTKNPWGSGRN
jgi:hypothetical protein